MKRNTACMGLLCRSRNGNDDIAEHKRRGSTGSRKPFWRCIHGKGKYVRILRDSAIMGIERLHPHASGEHDAEFGVFKAEHGRSSGEVLSDLTQV